MTTGARNVLIFAREEARAFDHRHVGTEHILLGLLREEDGPASRAIESLDVTVERMRNQVASIVGHGEERSSGRIPLTPRAEKVLELAYRVGDNLGANHIESEHILLGLIREDEGVAIRIIMLETNVDAATIRKQLLSRLATPSA